jgi:hypothetical protein
MGMRYIKTFESRLTQKAIIESIKLFLDRALPTNFRTKFNNSTLDIKQTGQKKSPCFIYVSLREEVFTINIPCYTLKGSNINILPKYIENKMEQSKIPVSVEYYRDDTSNYNEHGIVEININYYDEVINFFNQLPSDELEVVMNAHKYNL